MAITVSNKTFNQMGIKRAYTCDLAFDSSYAFGGESLTPANVGLSTIEQVILDQRGGYTFEYDYTNQKIKAFAPAPAIVFDEEVTVTANVGTLKYPAAYIMYVGVANEGFKVIPEGLTPVTKSVAVDTFTAGIRPDLTFLSTDTVTTCYVTYVTQAWKDIFDNLVYAKLTAGARVSGHASLTFTAGTPDVVSLGELAVAIQNITWDDNGTYKPMKALYKAETAATTEATIDFTDTTTKISLLQTDTMDAATDSIYITYIKNPGSGFLNDRFIEEDDLTPSSDVVTCSSGHVSGSNLLLFGTCGDLAGPTTKYANLCYNGATLGTTATLAKVTSMPSAANTFTFGSNHADSDHVKLTYLVGFPYEIPGIVPLEVPNTVDLSGITGLKATIIGR